MKPMLIPVIGLVVGTLGGTMYSGLKERDVILAEKEAEKTAALAEHDESADLHGDPSEDAEAASQAHGSETSTDAENGLPMEEDSVATDPAHAIEADPGAEPQDHSLDPAQTTHDPSTQMGIPASTETEVIDPGPDAFAPQTGPPPTEAPDSGTGFLSGENGGPERLAKIFGAMKAPDAAKVLQNLSDREVRSILSHISDRKAAEILGNFEPERAAALSRLVLGSPGGEAQ